MTDFGVVDSYVAEMKGVLLSRLPRAVIVDITHAIAPQDVQAGSIVLERAVRAFPAGTVHIGVVDPGVGSARKLLAVSVNGQTVICPDNGLITWTWHRHPGAKAHEIVWRPEHGSATFHGRDVMAPVAARLAAGLSLRSLCLPLAAPILLDLAPARSNDEVRIIHIDHFGNAVTNLLAGSIDQPDRATIRLGRRRILLRGTYADVDVGQAVALIGSSGLVEIAVRNGSAARELRLKLGMPIRIRSGPSA